MDKPEQTTLYRELVTQLEGLIAALQLMGQDHHLPDQADFLASMAERLHLLYLASNQVENSSDAHAAHIGTMIKNIFVQTLMVRHNHRLSILLAIQNFEQEQNKQESDLSCVLHEYTKHRQTTEVFIQELKLISDDVHEQIRRATG